ncbi:hypothetical protein KDL01_29885 [Actinospica durhamensis]|uniref:Uncharacterized protein n=1 Tax=Actinospica durhamensis TaxID=1508375 RepID=A0A941ET02_9ACTN|nr:hypothetical protein [Actinospica durhamensis]MBR7837527.1 hypothetical protein [Actinospica durhamensis]
MDAARSARVDAAVRTAEVELGPSPEMSVLQRDLFDAGVHGADAVMVTMRVMGVGLAEANEAFFGSPLRAAERDFQNWFIDALASAAETDERQ